METLISEDKSLRKFSKAMEILEQHSYDKSRLITILQQVQEEYRYLPKEVLTFISTVLNISVAEVYGVATFYAHFSLEAKGKYVIKICNGTACHVKGANPLAQALYKRLKLTKKKHTTDDMLFTVETVSCLGACGLAPVMVVNEKVYGEVTDKKVNEVIDEILKNEGGQA